MANVAAQIAREGRRRAPVIYAPGRAMVPAPVPQRRGVAPQRGTGVDWVAASQEFANTKAAQEQQAKATQPQQGGMPKGLGFLLGAMNIGFGGLQRGVTLGIEELAERLPQSFPKLPMPGDMDVPILPGGLGPLTAMVDTERTEEDERSNWEKVFGPTSTYGGGEILKSTGNEWGDRATGFAFDVLTDPLTYVSAGTSKLVQVPERAVTNAAGELVKIPAHAIKVPVRAGRRARLSELSRLTDEQALELAPDVVQAGQKGFANAPEIRVGGKKVSPLREALDIQDPKMQFLGADIPGTERLARPIVKAGGAIRAGLGKGIGEIPGVSKLGRGPRNMEEVTATLSKGSNQMPIDQALQMVRIYDTGRMLTGSATTRGNTGLRKFVRDVIDPLKRDKVAIDKLVRDTETPGTMTPLNKLMAALATIYEETAGVSLEGFKRDPTSYLPHMRTPGFKRMVKQGFDKGDPFIREFMEKTDFYVNDLLERSGFLEKSRKLTPDIDPETGKYIPKTLKVGPYEMTLRTGTIEEINKELGKLFPAFKGDFYETDPVRIVESYIASISKDAGARGALEQAASSGAKNVRRIEGQLAEALAESNRVYAAQDPLVEFMAANPYVPGPAGTGVPAPGPTPRPTTPPPPPGAAIPPVPAGIGALPEAPTTIPDIAPPPKMPKEVAGVELEDYFAGTKAEAATEARNRYLRGPARNWAKEARADIRDTRQAVAKSVYDIRKNVMKGLTKEINADESAIDVLTTRVAAYQAEIKSIGAVREDTHDQLVAFLVGIRKDIADLEGEITSEFGRVRSRITRKQNLAEKQLNDSLVTLRKLKRRAQHKLRTGPARFRVSAEAEIKRLMEPIDQAQARVDAKGASVPGKVRPEALIGAEQVMRETHGAASAQMIEEYRIAMEIVENAELDPVTMRPRTSKNRLTDEQMAVVEQARATVEELRPHIGGAAKASAYDEAQAALKKMTAAAEAAAAAAKAPVPVRPVEPPPAAVVPETAAVPEPGVPVRDEFDLTPGDTNDPRYWSETRDILADELTDIVDEANLDQVDVVHALSDADTAQFVNEMWDALGERGQRRLREIGWPGPEVPEQLALPSPAAAIPETAAIPEAYSRPWWDATKQVVLDMLPAGSPTRATIEALDDMQLRGLIDASWEQWPAGPKQQLQELGWQKEAGGRLHAPMRETKQALTIEPTPTAAAPTPKPVDKNALDYVPETLPEIRRKRDRLRRMFERGGQHYEEQNARKIIAQHEKWKAGVDNVTRDERKLLDLTRTKVNSDPRLAREQARLNEALTAQKLQKNVDYYTSRIQTGVARQKAMGDETITRRGPQGQVLRKRGFDPERDIRIPMEERAAGEAKIKPLAQKLDVARDVEQTGLETQRLKLRQMDEDVSRLETNVEEALTKRQTLIPKRAENERLRQQLQGTARNLSMKSKEAAAQRAVKSQKLSGVIDDVDSVVKADPLGQNDALVATEAQLHTHRADIERTDKVDITQRQAQKLIDMAGRKGDSGLAPVLLTTLNDHWHMLHDRVLAEGDIIVKAELHRRFQNIWSELNEPSWFGRSFNALTNLFKTYATLTPGFHVRNALSAMFMNMSDGVPMKTQYYMARIWKQYAEGGDEWLRDLPGKTIHGYKGEDIQQAIKIASGSGAGGRFTETGFAATSENPIIDRLMSNRLTRRSQRRGERVEGAVRMAMAMDSVTKGDSELAAMHRINRIHFDYSEVSALDEKAKRLIPFWTFMSRNLPMQLTQMVLKPRLYAQYAHLVRNFSEEPEQFTPEYWLKAGAFNLGIKVPKNNLPILGAASGLPIYMSPDLGFTRLQQDVENVEQAIRGKSIGGLMSNVNPLLTAPGEYYTRQDFFTGQQFPEGEGFEELGGLSKALLPIATLLQQTNEIGQVDPRFMNAIRAVNPLLDRTSRLAPQLMGGKGKDRSRQAESIARFFGVPIRTLTPEQQQSQMFNEYYEARDERERQMDMIKALLARSAG